MRAVYANCKLALSERPRSEDPYSKNPVFATCLASAGSQSERERDKQTEQACFGRMLHS